MYSWGTGGDLISLSTVSPGVSERVGVEVVPGLVVCNAGSWVGFRRFSPSKTYFWDSGLVEV
jgi:hypothetical protein